MVPACVVKRKLECDVACDWLAQRRMAIDVGCESCGWTVPDSLALIAALVTVLFAGGGGWRVVKTEGWWMMAMTVGRMVDDGDDGDGCNA